MRTPGGRSARTMITISLGDRPCKNVLQVEFSVKLTTSGCQLGKTKDTGAYWLNHVERTAAALSRTMTALTDAAPDLAAGYRRHASSATEFLLPEPEDTGLSAKEDGAAEALARVCYMAHRSLQSASMFALDVVPLESVIETAVWAATDHASSAHGEHIATVVIAVADHHRARRPRTTGRPRRSG
jgi:hypothetical protein